MLKEYVKVEKMLRYLSETLLMMVDHDGEDITCYDAPALDGLILQLVKARALMSIMDNDYEKSQC